MLSPRLAVVALVGMAACTTQQARRSDTTTPATATLAGAPATDAAAVRQAIEAQNTRFSAAAVKGDTATIAGLYTDDAIVMAPNGPAMHGHDAIAKGFASMSAMKLSDLKLQTQDVIVAGDYAIETGAYDLSAQPAKAKPVHDVGKYIVVWKKQTDGSYRLLRDIYNTDQAMPMK
jgi:uncharacterized protein (TIGR02246 family)